MILKHNNLKQQLSYDFAWIWSSNKNTAVRMDPSSHNLSGFHYHPLNMIIINLEWVHSLIQGRLGTWVYSNIRQLLLWDELVLKKRLWVTPVRANINKLITMTLRNRNDCLSYWWGAVADDDIGKVLLVKEEEEASLRETNTWNTSKVLRQRPTCWQFSL